MSLSVSELKDQFDKYNNIGIVFDVYDSEVIEEYEEFVSGYKCRLMFCRVEDLFVFFEDNPTNRVIEVYKNKDDAESKYMNMLDLYESEK